MGLINFLTALFAGKNAVAEVAEVFRPNAEKSDQRVSESQGRAIAQFANEFSQTRNNWFDSFVDGLNRLPRPIMAFSVLSLLFSALYDPIWFSERMTALALVPDQLWIIFGVIITFYFGGRMQIKSAEYKAADYQKVRSVLSDIAELKKLETPEEVETEDNLDENAALVDWKREN